MPHSCFASSAAHVVIKMSYADEHVKCEGDFMHDYDYDGMAGQRLGSLSSKNFFSTKVIWNRV